MSKLISDIKKNGSHQAMAKHKISGRLKKLGGSVKLPENFDEKKELRKHYQSKGL